MNWRDVLASVANRTPAYGYAWPSQVDGRFGVRLDYLAIVAERDGWKRTVTAMMETEERLTAERDRLRAVVDAARKTVGGSIQAIEAARAEEMGRDVILRNVSAALTTTYEQLDVSGDTGDG